MKKRVAKKSGRKYAKRVRRANKSAGYIRIVRRLPEQLLFNSSTLGVASSNGSAIVYGTPFTTPTVVSGYYNVPCSLSSSLDQLINYTDVTSLFDQYKISWVKIKIYCTSTVASSGSFAQMPSILYRIDHDDSATPASSTAGINGLREDMNSKLRMFYPGRPVTIFYRPRAPMGGNSATGQFVGTSKNGWINSTWSGVAHNGLKMMLQDVNLQTNTTANTQFKFDVTYCIVAKDVQ